MATNFRPAEKFDRTVRSLGSVQYFRFFTRNFEWRGVRIFAPLRWFRMNRSSKRTILQLVESPHTGESGFPGFLEPGLHLKESRIQVLLTKTGIQYLVSGIHSAESRIQNYPGFPYMRRDRKFVRCLWTLSRHKYIAHDPVSEDLGEVCSWSHSYHYSLN